MKTFKGYITKGDIVRKFEIMQQEGSYRYEIKMESAGQTPNEDAKSMTFIPRTRRGIVTTLELWETHGYTITWTEGEIQR